MQMLRAFFYQRAPQLLGLKSRAAIHGEANMKHPAVYHGDMGR
jgi:hypothetical protein